MTLQNIFQHCAEQGEIASTQACHTLTNQETNAYWQYHIEHYIHHWYSPQNHMHILEVLLELHKLGLKDAARVSLNTTGVTGDTKGLLKVVLIQILIYRLLYGTPALGVLVFMCLLPIGPCFVG